MIKRNKELGNGIFGQVNWTIHDVLQAYPRWSEEAALSFLKDIEEDLIEETAEVGADVIRHHRDAEDYVPTDELNKD